MIKTLYFNFSVFDFRTAARLPVFFFGPAKFPNLSGRVSIEGPIVRGMIQFGSDDENIIASNEPTRVYVSGNLIFKGRCGFAKAIQLLVWDGASMIIGTNAWFGSFSKVVAFRSITIGSNFMSSWECQFFDTDFHFLRRLEESVILDNCRPVSIGDSVWLGSRVTILKGTNLPSKSVVATGAVCNKDYSSNKEGCLLGGIPAVQLGSNLEYVVDKKFERKLFDYFRSHPQEGSIPDNPLLN